jgi:hypothetical protein
MPELEKPIVDGGEYKMSNLKRSKPFWKSKTIWAQIIGAAISILMLVTASPAFAQYAVYASLVINALTIVLRVLVDQPIEGGPKG